MRVRLYFNIRFAAALFMGCCPVIALAAIHVKLAVNNTTTPASLYVIENDSKCPGGPDDCIEVAHKSSPDLFFELDNACKAGGPDYKLQQIRIAMAEKDWPTHSNPLPKHVADDFYANAYSGVVDLVHGNRGWNSVKKSRIKFKDKNSSAYTVFYEITARQCRGEETIVLDPSVKNTGK